MSIMSSLKIVAAKKPNKQPPVIHRRNKLSTKLWEQLQLANIEAPKRVKPWWFMADTGRVCLSVRYGAKVLELSKGKSAVEVAGPTELIKTLETIKSAVDAGELDAQIEAASLALRDGFEK